MRTRFAIHALRRGVLPAIAALFVARGASAQWAAEFVIIKGGKDTVAIEKINRDAATLTGEMSQSSGLRTEYVANLAASHLIEHIEMARSLNGQSSTMSVDFGDTLVSATMTAGDKSQKVSLPTSRKPFAFLLNSMGLMEQIARANRLDVGGTARVTVVRLGAGDTATMTLTRPHADSLIVDGPSGALRLRVSPDGDVLGAIFPPQQWVIVRRKPQ